MPIMPIWWNAGVATNVENFVSANIGAFPANTSLYHGTQLAFFNLVTGFSGSEQQWVNNFFQNNIGGNAHAGPGIYAANTLAEANHYAGANGRVMTAISTTLQLSRYIDLTSQAAMHAYQQAGLNRQDVLRHAYHCIIRYTANYFAVKDNRVEWEPN